MKLTSDYLAEAVERFQPNGLHFEVSLSCQGEVWEELNAQITAHFASQDVILPLSPSLVGAIRFHQLPWVLLHPGNRTPDGRYSLRRHSTMTGVNFDLRHLRPIVHKMGNPCQSGQLMLNLGASLYSHPLSVLSNINARSSLWPCQA